MSEPIKFSQEELDGLGKIQSKYQENTFRFGQLYLDNLSLDEKVKQLTEAEASLRDNFLEIQKEEATKVRQEVEEQLRIIEEKISSSENKFLITLSVGGVVVLLLLAGLMRKTK